MHQILNAWLQYSMEIYFIFILVKANSKAAINSQANAFVKCFHAFTVPGIQLLALKCCISVLGPYCFCIPEVKHTAIAQEAALN